MSATCTKYADEDSKKSTRSHASSSSAEPTLIVFPHLSRTFKHQYNTKNYNKAPTHKRKRSATRSPACSFQVRDCPNKNGIGMFATQNILCGDIIIAHEDPMVNLVTTWTAPDCASANAGLVHAGPTLCNECAAPVGMLRENHIPGLSSWRRSDRFKKSLDEASELVFTTKHEICASCNQAAWCSKACVQRGREEHIRFFCQKEDGRLNQFYAQQENPVIFKLAIRAIVLTLSCIAKFHRDNQNNLVVGQFFWWKDYGSHSLWWKINENSHFSTTHSKSTSNNKRKQQTEEFCRLIRQWLRKSIQKEQESNEKKKGMSLEIFGKNWIDQICTSENIGSLLGMLQCNVMEFQYPSPIQQYVLHVQHLTNEDLSENEQDIHDSNTFQTDKKNKVLSLPDSESYLLHRRDGSQSDKKNVESQVPDTQPVLGSGLYPLLTLANHDCDPNASIEFLRESNQGSMVALRDIAIGEEICITYVPNGGGRNDNEDNDSAKYFRHFKPSRTWMWLNENLKKNSSGSGDEAGEDSGISTSEDNINRNDGESESDEEEDGSQDQEQFAMEGSDPYERGKALLEYGFECRCKRCLDEIKAKYR